MTTGIVMSVPRRLSNAGNVARLCQMVLRPDMMMFLPAATLAAFWLGGERALILTAIGLPLVMFFA